MNYVPEDICGEVEIILETTDPLIRKTPKGKSVEHARWKPGVIQIQISQAKTVFLRQIVTNTGNGRVQS